MKGSGYYACMKHILATITALLLTQGCGDNFYQAGVNSWQVDDFRVVAPALLETEDYFLDATGLPPKTVHLYVTNNAPAKILCPAELDICPETIDGQCWCKTRGLTECWANGEAWIELSLDTVRASDGGTDILALKELYLHELVHAYTCDPSHSNDPHSTMYWGTIEDPDGIFDLETLEKIRKKETP